MDLVWIWSCYLEGEVAAITFIMGALEKKGNNKGA